MTTEIHTDTDPVADAIEPLLRVRGPADLVHAIPYLLGFHPAASVVLVGLERGRVVVTARIDLADLAGTDLLATTMAALQRGGAQAVVAVIFDDAALPGRQHSDEDLPWAGLAGEVHTLADEHALALHEVALVAGGRLWSYTCDDPHCCPPDGRVLEGTSTVAATAAYAGLVALPDRNTMAALLDPDDDAERLALVPALDAGERDAVAAILRGDEGKQNRSVVRALFATARAWDEPGAEVQLAPEQAVRFGVALQRYPVRDSIWLAIDDGRLDGRELWRQLAARLPAPFNAAPLFLFGWASYRRGNGALAGVAAERALAADPGYSAADLLLAALSQGLDPRRLPKLRAPRRPTGTA
jgi:hypothetical protein